MKEKIAVLKRMLDESNYTVALCQGVYSIITNRSSIDRA